MTHKPKNGNRLPWLRVTMVVGLFLLLGLVITLVGLLRRAPLLSAARGLETATPTPPMLFEQAELPGLPVTPSPTLSIAGQATAELPAIPPAGQPTQSAGGQATTQPPVRRGTPTTSPTPTPTPLPTPTPTPTLDLAHCNAAGCGSEAVPLPLAAFNKELFLVEKTPSRRICKECPRNEQLSEQELNKLIAADPATLARLKNIVLSQQAYELLPGVVYIMFGNAHHIVVDLDRAGQTFTLRNIIPTTGKRGTLITPSYCLSPKSVLVIDADYHGLDGSNKTETGRDIFFHLGRAALFQIGDHFDLDVIRTRDKWDRTSISWGGGPIFLWNGRYDYNPEKEWFARDALEHYRTTHWTKITAAVSRDRKYLFISASYGLTLREHADNIINLGKQWGIKVDRAMRFDGSESGYMALRLGDHLVPILNLEEPLVVNCLAIEQP